MRRCPYCGEKIPTDSEQCKHCGKSLRKKKADASETSRLTRLDSWKQKSVPAWVMYAVVGVLLFCVVLMIAQGCEKFKTRQPRDAGATRFVQPPAHHSACGPIHLTMISRSNEKSPS